MVARRAEPQCEGNGQITATRAAMARAKPGGIRSAWRVRSPEVEERVSMVATTEARGTRAGMTRRGGSASSHEQELRKMVKLRWGRKEVGPMVMG